MTAPAVESCVSFSGVLDEGWQQLVGKIGVVDTRAVCLEGPTNAPLFLGYRYGNAAVVGRTTEPVNGVWDVQVSAALILNASSTYPDLALFVGAQGAGALNTTGIMAMFNKTGDITIGQQNGSTWTEGYASFPPVTAVGVDSVYRLRYDQNTGLAQVLINDVVVGSRQLAANVALGTLAGFGLKPSWQTTSVLEPQTEFPPPRTNAFTLAAQNHSALAHFELTYVPSKLGLSDAVTAHKVHAAREWSGGWQLKLVRISYPDGTLETAKRNYTRFLVRRSGSIGSSDFVTQEIALGGTASWVYGDPGKVVPTSGDPYHFTFLIGEYKLSDGSVNSNVFGETGTNAIRVTYQWPPMTQVRTKIAEFGVARYCAPGLVAPVIKLFERLQATGLRGPARHPMGNPRFSTQATSGSDLRGLRVGRQPDMLGG